MNDPRPERRVLGSPRPGPALGALMNEGETVTAPKPPQRTVTPPPAAPRANGALHFGAIPAGAGHRVLVYGPGGIGKTTLAASAPGPVAIVDQDQSLPRLRAKLDAMKLIDNVRVVEGVQTWSDLRAMLAAPGWDEIRTIVIDSATAAEELAIAHTLGAVVKENGQRPKSIEDYGYGKGYQHVFDTFLALLGDLDAHARAGRNVILICHDCGANVPNPMGSDWIRYEPRLQTSSSGKASIRLRVKEWADHVLFVGYDVDVTDGKAKGSGTATVYPREMPHFLAKSRTIMDSMPLEVAFSELWGKLFV